jgi:hypothetical protein
MHGLTQIGLLFRAHFSHAIEAQHEFVREPVAQKVRHRGYEQGNQHPRLSAHPSAESINAVIAPSRIAVLSILFIVIQHVSF